MINKKKPFHMQDGYKDEIFYIKISEPGLKKTKTELGNLKMDERQVNRRTDKGIGRQRD